MDQHLETFYSADVDMNGIQSHVSLWLTARTFTGALINGLYQQTVLGPRVCALPCVRDHARATVCARVCVCLHAWEYIIKAK